MAISRTFRWVLVVALLCAVAGAAGCSTVGYYWQAVNGQMEVQRKARPIPKVIADPATTPELKAKLERVEEIRDFASRELSLPDNGSYRRYADLGRPYVVWNVFAAPEFSVTPRQWCFPFAGCVGYKGYFKKTGADDLAAPPSYSEEIASGIGCELVVLPDAAHLANVEQPRAFATAMLDHLQKGAS